MPGRSGWSRPDLTVDSSSGPRRIVGGVGTVVSFVAWRIQGKSKQGKNSLAEALATAALVSLTCVSGATGNRSIGSLISSRK